MLLLTGAGQAQVSGDQEKGGQVSAPVTVTAPASVPPPKGQASADVKVPLLDQPLKISDFLNMEPRAELKDRLSSVENFIQSTPVDGKGGTEKTVVYFGHTKSALYIAFVCFDSHPELIRSHLARRENILKDDYVSVLLDPFQDRRIGVMFQINPAGVQADASWSEANGSDYSYDQVWDSDGRITRQGWIGLIALPFRSLRFRETSKDWGVVLSRNFPRNSETDYWPRVSANVSGTLSQEGTMHGISGVTGSHNVQINPYVLGQNEHALQTQNPADPYFSSRSFEGTAGGEAKFILRDSIIFDFTVNPDFSDVESDQPQFTVNQRYPVYFPELRPFFLENANYFATPLTLLYTRNIIRPEFGMRITGKVNHTNIGVLAIDDRAPGTTVDESDPLYQKRAGFFVGRIAQDIGKNSNIGAMYTDEEFGGGANRIGGLDFNFRLNEKWTFMGQGVESSTKGSETDSEAAEFLPGYHAGPASYLQIQRSAKVFQFEDDYTDIATGFGTTVGFIQTANIRADHSHATYQWFPKHSWAQSIGLETNQNVAFDHQGDRVYHYSQFDPFFLLKDNIVVAPILVVNSDTVGPQNGYPVSHSINFSENQGGFVARGQPFAQFNFNLQAFTGGNVNYYPLPGSAPFLLKQDAVTLLFTLQPIRQLTADQTYLLDRDHNDHTGAFVYESQTLRTKINYQFTRALSARVIVEYDSTLANPLQTSLQRTKQVQTQALLTWLPYPGTAVYVGWNNDLQNYNHTLCTRLNGSCDPAQPTLQRGNGYLNDGRQFFVKASYLFRF